MLDLGGSLGRRFGGIGAAVPVPSARVSAVTQPDTSVHYDEDEAVAHATRRDVAQHTRAPAADAAPRSGPPSIDTAALHIDDATWTRFDLITTATAAARRVVAHYGIRGGARVTLHHVIPPHQGLGSGTQLALATATAVAALYDLPRTPSALARIIGRARRSAIGTYVFAHGGFILEGGRRADHDQPAPLLARIPIPPEWRCVLVIPAAQPGVSGDAEAAAFAALPTPPPAEAARVAHLTLMALLPALVERDFAAFGAALTEIQCINGGWFAAAQGGAFAAGPTARLVGGLRAHGAVGVGQSSWGPAVYALAPDATAGAALAAFVREQPEIQPQADAPPGTQPGVVYEGPFSDTGARIWHAT
jgi:beta-RFAP synthase